jgi:2-oxoglutarate dehydrogenase E2 component (dihydrolipoamide succinyltransferase)
MLIDVLVPDLGESVSEVEVSGWLKEPGEAVDLDEPLIELESDKATVEVPAPAAGVISEFVAEVGAVLKVGDVLARIDQTAEAASPSASTEPAPVEATPQSPASSSSTDDQRIMPAAARAMTERGIPRDEVTGSGPGGRVLKEDVPQAPRAATASPAPPQPDGPGPRTEQRRRLTPIRRKIAERLVQSQQQAALLTTFNEIDMSRVKELRAQHQEDFRAKYGVKLGFMSFFLKSAVEALQRVPEINGRIEGEEMILPDYQDIGIAVGGGKGLVVPVIRNAGDLDFGEIEQIITDFADRAGANKIELSELEGGTFTISNGGVFGSLLSTPIINPPQSGVLGLHAIQDRAVVVEDRIEIRPMMYVALTYDHRLVDGREAVTFLKHVKECVEQPDRLLLKV